MINGPAYAISIPIATLFRPAAPMHLLLIVPAIVTSWWFLGLALDRGFTRWSLYAMFAVVVALLLWAASHTHVIFRGRLDYRRFDASTALLVRRFMTPAAWFIALTVLLCAKAKRVVRW